MIPIRDDNPTRHFPIVTILLIAANVIVYLFFELPLTQKAMIAFINQYGFVPSRLFLSEGPMTPIPPLLTVFTSMFLHGGIFIWAATCCIYGYSAIISKISPGVSDSSYFIFFAGPPERFYKE